MPANVTVFGGIVEERVAGLLARMERQRGFNFKLLVPPRVNYGQVSAALRQRNVENCGDFVNKLPLGYTKCCDKERSMPFSSTGKVAPSKPTREDIPKMKVVPPLEMDENNCNPGQLYSKLFDEVGKIKCWKAQVDNDTLQKERRLQENKITMETQRKAIQELQFANERVSMKLEEQINENEDLMNKNNATRNLCNILKDTFQRATEKMNLFESEREETHHLFMENSGSIQKLIAAFESLRTRAEADQEAMGKVNEDLLQFQELKEKYHQDNKMKEKEVEVLQGKLKDKDNELQRILLDLHETQKHCKQLQEAISEKYELLLRSTAEQESLIHKLHSAEQRCKETERNCDCIAAMLEQSKVEYAERIQSKDLSLGELSRVKNQQAEKLEQIQTTIQELQNSLALEKERSNHLEDDLKASNEELEKRNTLFGETLEQSAKKDGQIKTLEDELDRKLKSIDTMKTKINVTESRVEELTGELSRKSLEAQLIKNKAEVAIAEKDLLKKACEATERAHEELKQNSTVTEMKVQELEELLLTEKKKSEECTFQMVQLRKDVMQHEVKYKELLSDYDALQSEKTAIQQQFESRSSNVTAVEAKVKMSEEKAVVLAREIQRLEEENRCLQEAMNAINTNTQGEYLRTETLQMKMEHSFDHLQKEVTEKEKEIKAVAKKLASLRKNFEVKRTALEEYHKENKVLKKQIAKEIAKSSQLEDVITSLREEWENLQRLNEEDQQKLLQDIESKSTLAAELDSEVQKLRSTATEAIKNKEDTELKCQQKIADMVALMEKHKSQYDRMVEEKDAELDKKKKQELEAVSHRKSLELNLETYKTDIDYLKHQLKTGVAEKDRLQKDLADLRKEMSLMKINQLSEKTNQQELGSETIRTSSGTTPKTKKIHSEDLKTPTRTKQAGGTSKIRYYRIRTPPSHKERNIAFDSKSDSSDQNDIFSFTSVPPPNLLTPHCKPDILEKNPVSQKSPGNALRLAAMKRMRDAGWTAVTGCDKKKKKNERIFA